MLLMWLGELVSEKGIGNGISLLIFAGIASSLPGTVSSLIATATQKTDKVQIDWFNRFVSGGVELPVNRAQFIVGLLVIGTALTTYFVVKINEAQRVVTLSYAKRVQGNKEYGGVKGILPIKLITAGVVQLSLPLRFYLYHTLWAGF